MNTFVTKMLACKAMFHTYNSSCLCPVIDVPDEEWDGAVIETSVGVVVMNVGATVVSDDIGAGIDMLVCAEIIVALGAAMDALDCDSSVSSEERPPSSCAPCSSWPMTTLDCDCALQACMPSDHL